MANLPQPTQSVAPAKGPNPKKTGKPSKVPPKGTHPQPPQAKAQHSKEINEIMRRLRVLEERYTSLRRKTQLTDQNMLEDTKRVFDEIHVIQEIISDLKKDISDVKLKMRMLEDEMKSTVQKRDLDVLKKYLEFWEPMNFMRREEAKRVVEDLLEELKPKSF